LVFLHLVLLHASLIQILVLELEKLRELEALILFILLILAILLV
jgi:hypothetical protein